MRPTLVALSLAFAALLPSKGLASPAMPDCLWPEGAWALSAPASVSADIFQPAPDPRPVLSAYADASPDGCWEHLWDAATAAGQALPAAPWREPGALAVTLSGLVCAAMVFGRRRWLEACGRVAEAGGEGVGALPALLARAAPVAALSFVPCWAPSPVRDCASPGAPRAETRFAGLLRRSASAAACTGRLYRARAEFALITAAWRVSARHAAVHFRQPDSCLIPGPDRFSRERPPPVRRHAAKPAVDISPAGAGGQLLEWSGDCGGQKNGATRK